MGLRSVFQHLNNCLLLPLPNLSIFFSFIVELHRVFQNPNHCLLRTFPFLLSFFYLFILPGRDYTISINTWRPSPNLFFYPFIFFFNPGVTCLHIRFSSFLTITDLYTSFPRCPFRKPTAYLSLPSTPLSPFICTPLSISEGQIRIFWANVVDVGARNVLFISRI